MNNLREALNMMKNTNDRNLKEEIIDIILLNCKEDISSSSLVEVKSVVYHGLAKKKLGF